MPRDRRLSALSGGQRRRLDLAATLLHTPDALILDEPSNHLDDEASDYLVSELRSWRGPVLVASHDRHFLDATVDAVVDLDPGLDPEGRGGGRMGTLWTGGFTDYLLRRARLRETWAARWHEQQRQRARWEAEARLEHSSVFHRSAGKSEVRSAQKFYADRAAATLHRRARAAHQRLEDLERHAVPPPPGPLQLADVPTPGPGAPAEPVLVLDRAGLSGRLSPTDLVVHRGEHLLLTGPNGTGKSTLLSVLAGRLVPDSGQALRRDGLRIAVLSQDAAEHRETMSAAEALMAARFRSADPSAPDAAGLTPAAREGASELPGPLELGLLRREDMGRPLRDLSPGQRQRFELARVLASAPDALLLDEPTNHLSLGLSEDLERALADWPGTVVLCTHDRWIRERWQGRRLRLEG